ncbi:hypothetical protein LEMLEM_LOCUS12196 [Lemmus lemmus]
MLSSFRFCGTGDTSTQVSEEHAIFMSGLCGGRLVLSRCAVQTPELIPGAGTLFLKSPCGFAGWGRHWVRAGGVLVPNTSVPAVAPLDGADPGCSQAVPWVPNTSVPAVAPLNGADPGSPTPVCLLWLP